MKYAFSYLMTAFQTFCINDLRRKGYRPEKTHLNNRVCCLDFVILRFVYIHLHLNELSFILKFDLIANPL